MKTSPFHAGERAVQERLGVRERVDKMAGGVRDFMPDQHREFFETLPFMITASAGSDGSLWASLLLGEPGFARAPTPERLELRPELLPGDPLRENLRAGAPLGLLGIELSTRRRNRVNGTITQYDERGVQLSVDQSFGNCKRYIQARSGRFASPAELASPRVEAATLSAEALRILESTDTTFIATSSREAARRGSEGLDVSHRGGLPGFVRAETSSTGTRLTLPDYHGNFLFNSFGNLEVNPRAGFLALDFEAGAVLSLSGRAHVLWDEPEIADFAGAERLLRFEVEQGRLWSGVRRDFSPPDWSPQLLEP